mmetsp:Transcript_134/g.375  ORF Transcript_134/g.375 Transcript_134/m.375 type:complete len:182 (+) Transcript_134:113-658(+)|eukprot:CAMPEP_0198652998 /NCGR_PEP_ID=MMETSP1467-20131203/6762_1 /TAXON_ID=1462469 /ORGANISM="unid. sp., Strain CCMP2135" /LENGTH=181 /DNA_ID=CAMNT_0044388943 /DNA_START=103 /DNA_END=648 /DNA_ORIENTATION=-
MIIETVTFGTLFFYAYEAIVLVNRVADSEREEWVKRKIIRDPAFEFSSDSDDDSDDESDVPPQKWIDSVDTMELPSAQDIAFALAATLSRFLSHKAIAPTCSEKEKNADADDVEWSFSDDDEDDDEDDGAWLIGTGHAFDIDDDGLSGDDALTWTSVTSSPAAADAQRLSLSPRAWDLSSL